jgi:predicted nucleic acid-binding protein
LLAATNRRDRHRDQQVTSEPSDEFRGDPVGPVVVETDQLLRGRVGAHAARLFLAALAAGEHDVAYLSAGLLRRAVEIDAGFADLDHGFADAAVMALAERHDLPILTFDFEHFRATRPRRGYWRLVVDEARYADSTRGP